MLAEVIAIGDELVSGQRLDTNSRWLSAELGVLGVPVTFHTTAADTLEAGLEAFRVAAGRADLVVATGGLGPTADDLTRDVLAALVDRPLVVSPTALETIAARFAARGMPCPESNRRQAMFPVGGREIPNPNGTAPGIDLSIGDAGRSCRIFTLPGVPAEMRTMWRLTVGPAIAAILPAAATIVQRRIKCFGAGESAIEALLPDLVRRGREPLVGITAHEATITLRIAARGRDEADCQRRIAATEAVIRECLGELVFGVEDEELEDATLGAVAAAGGTLGIAEVGTSGAAVALAGRAAADRHSAGLPAALAGGLVLPPQDVLDATTLARRGRDEFAAQLGLGIGPVLLVDGACTVDVALIDADRSQTVQHVFAG
ncbi:MAG: competence/damage-inducible protein A, partial [Planctomycetes bacterium]|nr:competence/damage-inducible protein A [Planctomycetota bacterium]